MSETNIQIRQVRSKRNQILGKVAEWEAKEMFTGLSVVRHNKHDAVHSLRALFMMGIGECDSWLHQNRLPPLSKAVSTRQRP